LANLLLIVTHISGTAPADLSYASKTLLNTT